jgi:transposase-like protein
VAELESAGDLRAVARRYGVTEATLRWWRSELRRRGRASTRLLPVVVGAQSVPAAQSDVEVVVEIGQARITMRGAVGAEHLAAIIAASARTC